MKSIRERFFGVDNWLPGMDSNSPAFQAKHDKPTSG